MENCRRSVLFLFLSIFFIAFGVSARAETVEEKKAAANYDETLPEPEETPDDEEAPGDLKAPAEAAPVQVAKAADPSVPAVSVAIPIIRPVVVATSSKVFAPQVPAAVPSVPASVANSAKAFTPPIAEKAQAVSAAPKVAPQNMPEDQVFTASKPSGLVEVSGYKYPVFLFAPKDYKTNRTYAMIMIAPAEDAKAEKQIEYLTGLAQRKSIFILAPYALWAEAGATPYRLDEWLLTVKRDMVERFPISKKRVYLVGKDLGAHYAAYMAIKYPKEFAAVALLGEAWDGPFSQLIQPRGDAADQVPFYIALKADGNAKERNRDWFDKLQKKGYPLHLVDYKSDEELDDLEFKKSIFDWMEATSQSWEASVARGQQTWKGKFKKGVKDFFAV